MYGTDGGRSITRFSPISPVWTSAEDLDERVHEDWANEE